MAAPDQAGPLTPIPRWVAPLFAVLGIGLVPWAAWIAYELPQRHLARHWDVAWGGFDIAMAGLLIATAVAAVRRSPWIQGTATAAATMLICDAWFDMSTAARGSEEAMAIATAVLIELPLAGLCLWVARNAEHAHELLLRRRARPR
jgi:hypothetical protein